MNLRLCGCVCGGGGGGVVCVALLIPLLEPWSAGIAWMGFLIPLRL